MVLCKAKPRQNFAINVEVRKRFKSEWCILPKSVAQKTQYQLTLKLTIKRYSGGTAVSTKKISASLSEHVTMKVLEVTDDFRSKFLFLKSSYLASVINHGLVMVFLAKTHPSLFGPFFSIMTSNFKAFKNVSLENSKRFSVKPIFSPCTRLS